MSGIVQVGKGKERKIIGVVAGTFDKLHIAHKRLILEAFKRADHVIVGVMSDRFLSNKIASERIDPFAIRVRRIREYCDSLVGCLKAKDYEIVEISGPYDVVLEREDLDFLVVSEETLPKGIKINTLRLKKGWKPLELIVIPVIKSRDGRPITAHRVRLGEIDDQGNLRIKIYKNGSSGGEEE